jgi:Tfp pilus assembly protein PilF
MIGLSHLVPASVCRAARSSRIVWVCGAFVLMVVANSTSRAQTITTQMLIGDAVNAESLAKYTDVDEAIKRFLNRDVLAARTFLDTAKKKDPTLPPVDLLMAKLYFLAGNAVAGRATLEKTANDNPEDPEPFLMLADQAMQQGRTIEADALYDKALALTSKFNGAPKRKRNFEIRSRAGRAQVAKRRKNWDVAGNDFKTLLSLDPDNAMAHYFLGQILFMQQQDQEGYKEFVTAKQKEKNLPDPYVATALMYDELKNKDKAQQAFDRALASSKTDVNTIVPYVRWLIKQGGSANLAKAETVLTDARKANPGDLNLLILSGVTARMNKKTKPAEDYFVEALGIAPANGDVINQLALLLIEQPAKEKRERARQFAAMSAQLNNQSADAQITFAWVLYQLGLVADADQALRSGLQLGNPSPDSSYLVARILVDQNKPEPAKQILKAALDADTPGIFVYKSDAQDLYNKLTAGK